LIYIKVFCPDRLAAALEARHGGAHKGIPMPNNAFFDPLWISLAIIAACAGWVALEYNHGQIGWAAIAAAALAYGVWSLLISYAPNNPKG